MFRRLVDDGTLGLVSCSWRRVPWSRFQPVGFAAPVGIRTIVVTPARETAPGEFDPTAASLSVVIPALNAAAPLPGTLAALGDVAEIIVVDGGSTDATRQVAEAAGARVLTARRGRGFQIAAGIDAARFPWLLLLHADTRLSSGWRQVIDIAPSHAGYFRFGLASGDPAARRLERLVAWRCRRFGLPYGDQGLLIHRDLLLAVGGMKPLPLMEDVDLVRRLGRSRLLPLEAEAVTSAVKWETDGYLRRSCRNLLCLSLWFAGVAPETIRRIYG